MNVRLKPISPKRISDQVFDQLRELIFRGAYQPGQRFMTERELAATLGVSRNSVREAVNKLVTLRFLEQRQGQGTFVRSMDEVVKIPLATVMEAEDASLIDLLEMRLGIECNAASLAARRATADDLKTIADAIGQMERNTADGGLGTDGDLAFHMAVAAASKNPLQIYIMKNVADFLHVGIRENLLHLYRNPHNVVEIHRQHRAIFQAIHDGDVDAADRTMESHIGYVIRFFKHHLSLASRG